MIIRSDSRQIRVLFGLAWLAVAWLASCASDDAVEASQSKRAPVTALSEQTGLVVGTREVPVEMVRRVAMRQDLEPDQAVAALQADALFEHYLQLRRPDVYGYLERVALGRRLSEQFFEAATAQGPPTEDEVAHFTARNWWHLDRPVSSRTTHVVVIVDTQADEAVRVAAKKFAQRLRKALEGANDAEEFRARVEALKEDHLEVKVEDLAPVTPDGRTIDLKRPPPPGSESGTFDPQFARAANDIAEVGLLSPVVETAFGYHVLLLTERVAEKRLSFTERSKLLTKEIINARAHRQQQQLIKQAQTRWPVTVERSALEATELIRVPR